MSVPEPKRLMAIFFAFDLVPLGYSFGSDQAIGERIDASGNNNCVCPLSARSNGGWSRRHSDFNFARECGLGQDRTGIKDDDADIETILLKRPASLATKEYTMLIAGPATPTIIGSAE